MSVYPNGAVLDLAEVTPLVDLAPARASLIPREQHALMSHWGGPPVVYATHIPLDDGVSQVVPARVPPGVTEMWVWLAVSYEGRLAINVSTSVDPTGETFSPPFEAQEFMNGPETALWHVLPAIEVRSSVSWEWSTVPITIACTELVASSSVLLYGIGLQPLHVPR